MTSFRVHDSLPRVWTAFAVYVLSLGLAEVASATVHIAVWGTSIHELHSAGYTDSPNRVRAMLLLATGIEMTVIITVVLVAASLSGISTRDRLRVRDVKLLEWRVITGVCGLTSLSLCLIAMHSLGHTSVTSELYSKMLRFSSVTLLMTQVLVVGLLGGIAEELLFRGYIQTRLSERWGSIVGISVTAIMFGLIHYGPENVLVAGIVGMYLGVLAERSSSIVPAMVCHCLNNTLMLVVTAELISVLHPIARLTMAMLGVIGFAVAFRVIISRKAMHHGSNGCDPLDVREST